MSRTRKKKRTGGKAVDRTCRNHGSCKVCRSNRTIQSQRNNQSAKDQMP